MTISILICENRVLDWSSFEKSLSLEIFFPMVGLVWFLGRLAVIKFSYELVDMMFIDS